MHRPPRRRQPRSREVRAGSSGDVRGTAARGLERRPPSPRARPSRRPRPTRPSSVRAPGRLRAHRASRARRRAHAGARRAPGRASVARARPTQSFTIWLPSRLPPRPAFTRLSDITSIPSQGSFFFFSSPLLSSVPAGCGAGGDGGAGGERGEGKTGAPASRGGRGRPRSEPAAPAHRPRRRLCSARFLGFLADCFAGGAGLEKQLQWL